MLDLRLLVELWLAILQLLITSSSLDSAVLFTLQQQHVPSPVIDTVLESTVPRVSSIVVKESSDEIVLLCLQVCHKLFSQCSDAGKSSPTLIVCVLHTFRTILAKPSNDLHRNAFELIQSIPASAISLAVSSCELESEVTLIMRQLT